MELYLHSSVCFRAVYRASLTCPLLCFRGEQSVQYYCINITNYTYFYTEKLANVTLMKTYEVSNLLPFSLAGAARPLLHYFQKFWRKLNIWVKVLIRRYVRF